MGNWGWKKKHESSKNSNLQLVTGTPCTISIHAKNGETRRFQAPQKYVPSGQNRWLADTKR